MKIRKSHIIIAFSALMSTVCVSCAESGFKVKGEVENGADKTLVLEKSDFHGNWIAVDSTRIGRSGGFSIKADAPASPEIYRLSLGDRFIYFPVDSVETITLKTSADGFGRDFTLAGSRNAELLGSFEKDLLTLSATDSASIAKFKRDVYTKYIKDGQGSIVSYYVLTKFVDGKPLYDPASVDDAKYYAAVATQFDNYRPNDPHGQMVKSVTLNNLRARNSAAGKKRVVEAEEIRVLDIDLPNEDGRNVRLADVVGKGKPVVLIFSQMNAKESPLFNRELNSIYESKGGRVEFYHVSFDEDRYTWRDAARNLPWINVIDPGGNASNALVDYNVTQLPAVFIYDAVGDLIDRPESLQDLRKKL